MIMQKNAEQNDSEVSTTRPRQNRSPSAESVSRLHQQSGGFAGPRRISFHKENYHQNNGFRRQNYQRGRSQNYNHQRYAPSNQGNHQLDYSQQNYGYHQKHAQNRSYQAHQSQNYYKNQYYQQQNSQNPQRLFNLTSNEPAPYSSRHPPLSSSPAKNEPAKAILYRGNDVSEMSEEPHDKIHKYRAAGTAPGGYSVHSSPFKQPPPQPPSTPADKADDRQRFPMPPPGLQQHRRPKENVELMLKTKPIQIPVECMPMSVPNTPCTPEALRMTMPDAPLSVDNVDATHQCFQNERLQQAMNGLSPQVKSQLHPPGIPILSDREASLTMEEMHNMHLRMHHQQFAMHQPLYSNYIPPMFPHCFDMAQLIQMNMGAEMVDMEKQIRHREPSVQSRESSHADPEATVEVLDKLDREVAFPSDAVDSDQKELPARKDHVRRDSDCTTISSADLPADSAAVDESTLTKIMPTDEFHGGRGVVSPSPPSALVSEPLSRMDVLSEKIWDYHNKVAQTEEMLMRKLHLRDMLYTAISPVFPMSGLYVVGSSLNGFGNNSSDMDLCLMITNKDLDQKNDAVVVLNLILSTLQYEKFVASQKLILAKVPILRIKFAAPFDDITVDLNANNSVAIRNTHLLCYYSSYDWRVRPLVSVVKEWAKRKGINDANKSSFTSYSLVLMVIHYLQCGITPRVLPNLQQTYPDRFSNKVDVRTLNVTMPLDDKSAQENAAPSEKTTLGELLIGFLDYYANSFDYDRDAISIRQGQRVERATLASRPKMQTGSDKETPPPSTSASSSSLHNVIPIMHHSMANPHFWRSQWRCVCIEEPFTNSNTAHSIYDEMVFEAIKEAFREAHAELQHNHDLDRLMDCEPIKASTNNAGAAVFAATYEGERPLSQQPNSIASSIHPMGVISAAGMNTASPNAHFHYQQQSPALKQQRNHQSYPVNRHQGNRRFQQGPGSSRNTRSNDSFNKEASTSQSPRHQHAKGGAKESHEKKQQQSKKEESNNKQKRSPDGKSKEKTQQSLS